MQQRLEQVGRLKGRPKVRHIDRTRGVHPRPDLGSCAFALLPVGGIDQDVVAIRPVQPDTAVVPGQECRRIGERDHPANRAFDRDAIATDDKRVLPLLVDDGIAPAGIRIRGSSGYGAKRPASCGVPCGALTISESKP